MVKHVEIENNGYVLRGYYTYPNDFNGDVVVMFHGFTGNKTEHAGHFRNLARLLEKEGIASLRMDFFGNGESDGEFSEFTYDTMLSDAFKIIEYAKNVNGFKRLILLGFSMGGALAATVSTMIPNEISKMVLWSPAGNIVEIIKNRFDNNTKLENGNAIFGSFELSKEMYESVDKWHTYENLEEFENKVLIINGRKDLSVPYLYSARYSVNFKNSHLYLIDGAGHGYDERIQHQKLYELTLNFLKN